MHEHLTLQDFILSVFSIGTPFFICSYCCFKFTNKYFKAMSEDESEDESEYESENEIDIENELSPLSLSETSEDFFSSSDEEPSPRTLKVIEKYGHFKPDYSDISGSSDESD
jgi:hypothetical protein